MRRFAAAVRHQAMLALLAAGWGSRSIRTKSASPPPELVGIKARIGAVMAQTVCASCNQLFIVRPQSPMQSYCSETECQRKRRQLWNKRKLHEDPDYRANQRAAQQAWHARNPDYWQTYRGRKTSNVPIGSPRPTHATSDASSCGADAAAGMCWIEIHAPGTDGLPKTWRVELTVKPPVHFANSDACK